ncbi:MAG: glutathione S-transferase family protein [Deltaproteobacteria bacterium]|nr:glutathione S-transferase family protein [Deltaproteobacteria bacterium]
MPTAILYSQPMNPFSEKVACALALKGMEYRRADVTDVEEIKRLSPDRQTLPVLEVDGERVSDSPEILRWLDRLVPEPSLFSTDPRVRRQQESLAEWSDSSFAFYWNRWRALVEDHERRQNSESPGILSRIHQHVEERMGIQPDGSLENISGARGVMEELEDRMNDLVGFLGSRPYFFADEMSVADLAVFGMLLLMRDGPMPRSAEMVSSRPTLATHLARLTKLTQQGTGTREHSPAE